MKIESSVTAVAGKVITISGVHGAVTSVDVSTSTTYTSNGAPSTLAAVVIGVHVQGNGLPGSTARASTLSKSMSQSSVTVTVTGTTATRCTASPAPSSDGERCIE